MHCEQFLFNNGTFCYCFSHFNLYGVGDFTMYENKNDNFEVISTLLAWKGHLVSGSMLETKWPSSSHTDLRASVLHRMGPEFGSGSVV